MLLNLITKSYHSNYYEIGLLIAYILGFISLIKLGKSHPIKSKI